MLYLKYNIFVNKMSYNDIKVSVIIPTYNRYKYLLNAVESVKSQTHKNIEIIVVNDASTQSKYYENKIEDVIMIHLSKKDKPDVGCAARARNIGIMRATGEYISFLDDDDYWYPDKIHTQLHMMYIHGTEMCCSEAHVGDGPYDNKKLYKLYLTEYHKDFYDSMNIILPVIWDKAFLHRHNSCITSSIIISRDIIRKIGFMPYLRVGEDYEYWLKAIEYTKCVFVSKPILYYDMKHGDGALY